MIEDYNKLVATENKYVINVCGKLPFSVVKGKGVYVYDQSGQEWLDLYGGHAVALTGHCHPHLVEAVTNQINKLVFYSNITYSSLRTEAARLLTELTPESLSKVYFGNSGAEANEAAMKFARKSSSKKQIISMKGAFHGRTYGALSLTWNPHYKEPFTPLVPGIIFIPFGDLEALKDAITPDTAAVIIEPIQSVAGIRMADPDYYQGLRELTLDNDIILIFDEIQTGLGRTGVNFFGDHYDIAPDMITVAKGLASGIPISATIVHEDIASCINPGDHASTFGGGPIAAAAAIATLEIIQNENLVDNAKNIGEYAKQRFPELRGKGLLLGLPTFPPFESANSIVLKARESHIIIGGSGDPLVARILPPLTINQSHIDKLKEALV